MKKVLLISVDGMRPDAMVQLSRAQKLMAGGAVTLEGTSVVPPVTLPCHMSMFHSVEPDEEWEGRSFVSLGCAR